MNNHQITSRVENLPWESILNTLHRQGFSTTEQILTQPECQTLIEMYGDRSLFRSRVIMQQHSYGRGEYQYFDYPLPEIVSALRDFIYPKLVAIANQWHLSLKHETIFPNRLSDFLEICHQAGQTRPTPLLLKYEPEDFNCLHQDLYGQLTFPFQVAIVLSKPNTDFTGGEFVLVEQRPRMQSKVRVVPLSEGQMVVFAVNHRPVRGKQGFYRVSLKHGVSQILSGRRFCMGIIFHDAV